MSVSMDESNTDDDLKRLFENTDDPVLTAIDVAGELGISQQAAYNRLSNASDAGQLTRKKVGARAVVWWPVRQGSGANSSR